jgi:predicted metal-binding protein
MVKSTTILEDEITEMALNTGAYIVSPINLEDVVVANWVRLKCQYGCPSYGKKLSCPPYSPTPEDTRKVLSEYSKAYLIGYKGSTLFNGANKEDIQKLFPKVLKDVRNSLFEIEKHAFLSGYYKSFVYGFCGPCTYCETCVVEDQIFTCKYAAESRPSMEASGIDVFKTVENAGLKLEVQKDANHEDLRMYTLLLLE